MHNRNWTTWSLAALLGGVLLAAGCSGPQEPDDLAGVRAAERAVGDGARRIEPGETPPALIDGEPVGDQELLARLSEAQGGAVLEEIVLDRGLERELARRGLSLSPGQVEAERALLERSLGAEADERNRQRLLLLLRQSRGLGPVRFDALLRRNAMLRSLVAERVEVTADQIDLAWRIRHGERVRVRLIAVQSEQSASALRRELLALEGAAREARFVQIARERSVDPTAPAGGLVEAFSVEDPAYEAAVREAARTLPAGELSQVVAIRTGFALVMMQDRIPPTGVTLEGSQDALRRDLRARQERLLMDELAQQLLAEARVTVFDPGLSWSWSASERRSTQR